jgi:hypothetical protein
MGKSLAEKNTHLLDADKRKRFMIRNVETSSAIEGIRLVRYSKTGQFVAQGEDTPPKATTISQ